MLQTELLKISILSPEGTTTEEIISKWETLQFLDGAKNKQNCALAFELMAKYLIDNHESLHLDGKLKNNIETLIFPITRKIVDKIENDLPIEEINSFVVDVVNQYSKLDDGILETSNNHSMDVEAELCSAFADKYQFTT